MGKVEKADILLSSEGLSGEQPFGAILEQAGAGIVYADLDGNLIFANSQFRTLLGYDRSEVNELSIGGITHPDDLQEIERSLAFMLGGGPAFVIDNRYVRKDGSSVWATTSVSALRNASGKTCGITVLILDITARKRAEAELERRSDQQQRLYETVLSNTPDFVYVFDKNFRFTYANAALLKTWGKTWNEAIGKSLLELGYASWHAERHEREIRQVIASRQPVRGEVPFHGTDGLRVYDYIFAPIFNSLGDVEGIAGTARDVTDRQAAERAVKENEERFRILADNIAQIAWMADERGQLYWFNQRWVQTIGLTSEQPSIGENVVHPDFARAVREKYFRHIQAGTDWEDTFPMRCQDGRYRWFLSRAVPIRNSGGQVTKWLGTNTDISELKETEEALHESQERLQAALQAARAGTFRWDIRTNNLEWDGGLDRLFGLEPGKTARSLAQFIAMVHPDDRTSVRAACERCAADGSDFDLEFRVVWKDGSVHWLDDKGKTIFEDGRPAYMTGACVEITERKNAEIQTHQQRDILEQIVAGVSLDEILESLTARIEKVADRPLIATILLIDKDGVTLRPAAGRNAPSEWNDYLRGQKIGPAVGSCGTAAFRRERVVVEDISTDPLWKPYAANALRHNLRACWSTPILSSDSRVLGTFAVYYTEPGTPLTREIQLVDIITRAAAIAIERKQSEQALEDARTKLFEHAQTLETRVAERTASLREAISQMEEFSYTVSHDLRAPLRGMQVYSEALREDFAEALPLEAQRYIDKIIANSDRLDKMILDVLTFSRLARSEVTMGPVALDTFVRELLLHYPGLQPPLATIDIEPLLPVIGHEPSITQVISNLLGNAVKFVRPGEQPRVRLRTERRGDNVRIWIEDSGIGIPPEYQHRLFNMFERVHANLPYEGTGVGLAIVRKAMERMNGTYGVESQGGNGSKFWIELKSVEGAR